MNIDIEKIKEIAKKSGEKVLEYYYKDYNISYKDSGGKKSPLTEADLASNKIIMEELEKYNFPILSEETEDDLSRLQSEYVWIVDPLDGTSDFMEKTGEFSILIGLVKNGEPVLGVVFEPAKNTFYWAEKGKGAFMEKNGKIKKINVSNEDNFQDMTILLSRNHLLESDKKLCENLKIGKQTKRGSTSKMCVIARGDAEIYVNTSDKTGEWDTCAPQVVLTEAGGKIVDMRGKELMYNKKNPKNLNGFVVSNGENYARIVEELKRVIKS
ncbi:MAG: hypothetical protein UR69_C0001G0127 [Candidatus Moranbacteria bacterium GW2011_GWE2_35_2-]|nr:MAG: hypothetical protein UR69_C0001G0127 [Candidatus Moranbacteria bacterium GW2011_GWE2_35_2-]KKQ06811.1 MAG: hypothetical protein US15_C0003G0009 [Candidatus Moranbacteria bacterium GW2011_GWF1_36_4]KKQ22875.1 MAG: hypothetical protein US37_C0001G0147 [Candidatus Moranbacteria bacterium GW2011_GWF2_37_11]KKQ29233.1 MAG: hypothetical protein US44_C0002G0015 [Candidatus Moranbacteria bacterium GW2011_GWD1_37_17]KKQ30894.1 MAG: hypothetical protein US47_C0001G0127 [Candidatus Moranbacteria b